MIFLSFYYQSNTKNIDGLENIKGIFLSFDWRKDWEYLEILVGWKQGFWSILLGN